MSGAVSHHAGLAAEDLVARRYAGLGLPIVARRWRCGSGEIDLILRDGEGLVFVEVKCSRTHALAAEHLTPRQISRILAAATEFVANEPLGLMTEMRFDVALVDGTGRIEVLENALAA